MKARLGFEIDHPVPQPISCAASLPLSPLLSQSPLSTLVSQYIHQRGHSSSSCRGAFHLHVVIWSLHRRTLVRSSLVPPPGPVGRRSKRRRFAVNIDIPIVIACFLLTRWIGPLRCNADHIRFVSYTRRRVRTVTSARKAVLVLVLEARSGRSATLQAPSALRSCKPITLAKN